MSFFKFNGKIKLAGENVLFTCEFEKKKEDMESKEQDYDDLLRNYVKLQTELELTNQTLYEYRRHVETAHTVEAEYQDEIKMLQAQGTLEQQKLQTKVRQLEEDIVNLKATYNDRINCLERELSSKDDEINDLKKEIDSIIKIAGNQESSADEKLFDEITNLREQNLELLTNLNELERALRDRENQKQGLEETIKHLNEELENYKETLECKRGELEEANTLIENLKDDYQYVKTELDTIRSKPLDNQSKGNSLFAEVDDRRLQLQQNMNIMKSQYIEMKRERASFLKQIATLRNENATLIAKFETEIDGKKRDDEMILDSYKYQIQTLNDLIESYKKELKDKSCLEEVSSNEVVKFFSGMIDMKNDEIEDLRKKLSSRSFNHTSLSYDLAEANRSIRKCTLENVQLKDEIAKLKNNIEDMKLVSPTEKAAPEEVKLPKSIVKPVKLETIDLDETNKENENATNKKVQFTEDVVEPHVTDRNKRRGAKVVVTKFIKY